MCMQVCIYVCICVYVCVCVYMCVYLRMHPHPCTHTHTQGTVATIKQVLTAQRGTSMDKLRLVLVFLLTCEELPNDTELQQLESTLSALGADMHAFGYVLRMRKMKLTGVWGGVVKVRVRGLLGVFVVYVLGCVCMQLCGNWLYMYMLALHCMHTKKLYPLTNHIYPCTTYTQVKNQYQQVKVMQRDWVPSVHKATTSSTGLTRHLDRG